MYPEWRQTKAWIEWEGPDIQRKLYVKRSFNINEYKAFIYSQNLVTLFLKSIKYSNYCKYSFICYLTEIEWRKKKLSINLELQNKRRSSIDESNQVDLNWHSPRVIDLNNSLNLKIEPKWSNEGN